MFLLIAGGSALGDVLGAQGTAIVVLGALVVVLLFRYAGRGDWLDRQRGVQRRGPRAPWVYGVAVALVVIALLLARGLSDRTVIDPLARATGLGNHPATVAGVLFGAVFTLLFFGYQRVLAVAGRRSEG